MRTVYVLQHESASEDVKLIGVYGSDELALLAGIVRGNSQDLHTPGWLLD